MILLWDLNFLVSLIFRLNEFMRGAPKIMLLFLSMEMVTDMAPLNRASFKL